MAEDLTRPYFGNPNVARQGAKARELAQQRSAESLPDPRTYGFMQGLFGTPPEQLGMSVLSPNTAPAKEAAYYGYQLGNMAQIAPALKPVGLLAGSAINDAMVYGSGPLAAITPQPMRMVVGRGVTPELSARANQMLNTNASPGRILQETGLVQVPTKDGFTWGKQISDAPFSADFEKLKNASYDAVTVGRQPGKAEDIFTHPELFNLYPELKNIGVVRTSDTNAFYRSGANEIGFPSVEFTSPEFLEKFTKDRTAMALHELQHAVQTIEQWPRGGNTAEFMGQAHKKVKEQADWAMKSLEDSLSSFLVKQGLTAPKDFKSFVESVEYVKTKGPKYLENVGPESKKRIEAVLASEQEKEFLDAFSRIQNSYKKIKDSKSNAGKKYTNLAGEAQARATEQQFLENNYKAPVTSFYDVPVENLIYKDPFPTGLK
jgi:hypothetical protein